MQREVIVGTPFGINRALPAFGLPRIRIHTFAKRETYVACAFQTKYFKGRLYTVFIFSFLSLCRYALRPERPSGSGGAGPARVYKSIYFQTFRHNRQRSVEPPLTSNSIIHFSISTINTTVYAGKKELLKIFIKACKSARLLVHGRWLLYVQKKSNL